MNNLDIVILAAGKGERMVSRKPKVMHEILGKPLVGYVIDAAKSLDPSRVIVVTGLRPRIGRLLSSKTGVRRQHFRPSRREPPMRCHAPAIISEAMMCLFSWAMCRSCAGIRLPNSLSFAAMRRSVVFLVTDIDRSDGYGRVLMDGDVISDIREHSEASDEEKKVGR